MKGRWTTCHDYGKVASEADRYVSATLEAGLDDNPGLSSPEGTDVGERMQQLLSQAVDEQVNEQRQLQALLVEVRGALGNIQDEVRAASPDSLRTELSEHVRDTGSQLTVLDERLQAMLGAVETSAQVLQGISDRLERIADLVRDEAASTARAEPVAEVRQEVADLRQRIDGIEDVLRTEVSGLQDRLGSDLESVRAGSAESARSLAAHVDNAVLLLAEALLRRPAFGGPSGGPQLAAAPGVGGEQLGTRDLAAGLEDLAYQPPAEPEPVPEPVADGSNQPSEVAAEELPEGEGWAEDEALADEGAAGEAAPEGEPVRDQVWPLTADLALEGPGPVADLGLPLGEFEPVIPADEPSGALEEETLSLEPRAGADALDLPPELTPIDQVEQVDESTRPRMPWEDPLGEAWDDTPADWERLLDEPPSPTDTRIHQRRAWSPRPGGGDAEAEEERQEHRPWDLERALFGDRAADDAGATAAPPYAESGDSAADEAVPPRGEETDEEQKRRPWWRPSS